MQHDTRQIATQDNFIPQITPYLRNLTKTFYESQEKFQQKQDRQKAYADQHRRPAPLYKTGGMVMITTHVLIDALKATTSKRESPSPLCESEDDQEINNYGSHTRQYMRTVFSTVSSVQPSRLNEQQCFVKIIIFV